MASAFEKVTRNMLENLSDDFKQFRTDIKGEFTNLKKTNEELYNHLSTRIPQNVSNKLNWLYGILGTIIGGVIVGVTVTIFRIIL